MQCLKTSVPQESHAYSGIRNLMRLAFEPVLNPETVVSGQVFTGGDLRT
jgi:hypothetical protein